MHKKIKIRSDFIDELYFGTSTCFYASIKSIKWCLVKV